MSTDRELLELAARATGIGPVIGFAAESCELMIGPRNNMRYWRPLTDDGDALRLAVKLHIEISMHPEHDTVICEPKDDPASIITTEALDDYGVRRAIVRAAAEIGRNMP